MEASRSSVAGREDRLGEILAALLEAQESAEPPDRAAWLARYPESAELNEFFVSADRLHSVAAPLRAAIAVDTPAHQNTVPDGDRSTPERVGQRIGDYEVLEEVGRGGMGVVFKARQQGANRVVALKLLRFDPLGGDEQARRFRNEAEIVAQLDHPHIVPLYEVGEYAGRVYFSMKLLDGGSLADRLSRFAADPRAAARLVADVARAVHFAHQRGVLHRDLKPGNVLLDGDGRPLVTDFGLARRVESDSSLTQSGAIVGTPSYMAPEQAAGAKGAATTAADVWGLGAVLYALLTGRPPFRGETVLETLEQVKGQEPESPRRLNRRVDRDLETVCLKCLRKEPGRRYEAAQELAEDLERWLAGEPVRARRAGPWELAAKWVRRRPALAGLLGVSALAVLGLVTGLVWHNDQLRDSADRERNQALEANRQKEEAQKKRAFARRAADRMYTQVAEKWLASEPGSEKLQREFLEEALRFYQELAQEPDADPSVQQELANAYRRMGAIHLKPGRPAEAEQALGKAADIGEKLTAQHPDQAEYQDDLASIYYQLGNLNKDTSRPQAGEEFYRRSLAIFRKQAARFPSVPAHRQTIGTALINLGSLLKRTGRQREAEEAWREARSVLEKVTEESPEAAHYHIALGGVLNNLAILLSQQGKSGDARGLLEDAIRHQRTALEINPRNKQALIFLDSHYSCLSVVLRQLGEPTKALGAMRESITVAEHLVAEFPETVSHRTSLAASQAALGQLYRNSGKPEEAAAAFRSALATMEKAAADFPRAPVNKGMLVNLHNELGAVLFDHLGKYKDAEAEFRQVLRIRPNDFNGHHNLGHALYRQHRYPEAVAAYREALKIKPADAVAHYNLGKALRAKGRLDEAVAEYQEAIRLKKDFPEAHNNLALTLQWKAAAGKLPGILKGEALPADADERLALGTLCQQPFKRLYAASARFYAEAFTQKPELADDLGSQHRYNAACAAALAGCGQGEDAANRDDKERAGLRNQALDWLKADLQAYRRELERNANKVGPAIAEGMQQWLKDDDFAGARGTDALARLPEAERHEWQKLWEEVEALRRRAAGPLVPQKEESPQKK
jgi:serine/threonine-protein kinase